MTVAAIQAALLLRKSPKLWCKVQEHEWVYSKLSGFQKDNVKALDLIDDEGYLKSDAEEEFEYDVWACDHCGDRFDFRYSNCDKSTSIMHQ